MFRPIPYSPNELRIVEEVPGFMGTTIPVRNYPVSPRQNYDALYAERKPFWMPGGMDSKMLIPPMYNNNLGRGGQEDIVDCFGVKWQYVPSAGGSIVHPGAPLLEDINDWRDVVKMPNIDEWDWEGAAAASSIDLRYPCQMSFINGFWFERLISFLDFMPAAIALIDEEQTDAIKDLFAATTELGCKLVDKFCEYFPAMDGFNVHDDWGAQKAPFFSQEVAYELFVPYMKQLTDHIHSKGRVATLHSCGHNADRIQCFIDGGFDQWAPQPMNDIKKLYREYGDKIVLAVWPDPIDWANTTEEEQRAHARKFVEEFNQPGKPSTLGFGDRQMTPAFLEEVYIHSRKLFAERG